ncbi:uncharacterized protein LOC141715098 [Apium graveolens]|uniref:uncharacterized protein LOC141715098 n=1 Tax=Apium graveolens TaxID=4045 RepID=UPI003D78E9E6
MSCIIVIKTSEDPTKVSLQEVDFWIQIHNLPIGYMTETVGKQLCNFFGTVVQNDAKNNSSIWCEFMRLRIRLDMRKPLKMKKKIVRKDRTEVVVLCKYEKLGDFCFVYRLLSHTERFCKKKLDTGNKSTTRDWGQWLRTQPRRGIGGSKSKWLRDEEGGDRWHSSDRENQSTIN